ncbi:MAG: DUF2029 domain-containing protein [Rhodocyclaceae bacterium]|nr:DUF2029 domain-containing protein [Rhodocyclaceae bacterium]
MKTPRISSESFSALIWLLVWLLIAALLMANGLSRSVTPIYHRAVDHWQAGQALYYGPKEFNYLPVFVGLFWPFHRLPIPVGDIVWRLMAVSGLIVGITSITRLQPCREHGKAALIVTLIALPLSVSALRNGQSSAHIGALFILAASALNHGRWNLAALLLSLALVCKPLAVPMIGLALILFPHVRGALALGTLAVFFVPYAWAGVDYVNEQYLLFFRDIVDCMDPTAGRSFADINAILRMFGYELDSTSYFRWQVLVGLLLAAICFFSRKHLSDFPKTLTLLGLGGGYIMLFTPMNENNSYVMVAPVLALWACWCKYNHQAGIFVYLVASVLFMAFGADVIAVMLDPSKMNEYNQTIMSLTIFVFFLMVIGQLLIFVARSRHDA